MADNRSRLEKLVGMLGSDHDGECLNALRMIKKIAAEEKKSLPELLLSGVDRIVYRDRPQPARPHPKPERNYRDSFKEDFGGFDFEEMARKARENAERNARTREEARQREAEAKAAESRQRYGGAFDDAEMTDEQREAARARRKARKEGGPKQRRSWDTRELLDELNWALENNDDDLTGYEIEFASQVPFQYRFDYELSSKQIEVAKRIIRKVKSAQQGSPI